MMRNLSELIDTKRSEGTNNFLLLRLVAASLVIYGHSPAIAAPSAGYADFFSGYVHFEYSGAIGLFIFFVISGFLVTKSFVEHHNVTTFLINRFLRIMPAFLICVLICTFVLGAMFTTLPFHLYIWDPSTWDFVANASLLHNFAAYLPGVVFTDRPYGMAVDGSLWSLFIEARLYLIVALLGGLGVFRSQIFANVAILSIVVLIIIYPNHLPMAASTRENLLVCLCFTIGGLLYINRSQVVISSRVLPLMLFACYLSRVDASCYQVFCMATMTYAVFVVAYAPKIPMPRFVQDYSYGTYLYGWPVQQILAYEFPAMGPLEMTGLALGISWCLGALSWFFVEKPSLSLKRRWDAMPVRMPRRSAANPAAAHH